ncbi:unnamed protein product [Fusarium venenatum]|uniref:Zn(2)-C6 fungal-type domain-containing protein n=1 Tax=Fusarium venenatum TaxID=56646 RepID=A0A2L2THA3_9HYPO|nr:uncharacterized protein FVRRES_06852 [Fusarium venenatum]CEI62416.1 unnamed protein product [Fusarium venenatum]
MPDVTKSKNGPKRARLPASDKRYPRKRGLTACHVCRARKTKCDNVQPTCGFCASLNIPCSYDNAERNLSQFDPASLEILRQLGQIISTQNELTHTVRSIAASQSHVALGPGASQDQLRFHGSLSTDETVQPQHELHLTDWFAGQSDSASTTPSSSASAAAVQWFGILANDAPNEEVPVPDALQGDLLDTSPDGQTESDITPLQRATRAIDTQPGISNRRTSRNSKVPEESLWQASGGISLLDQEQDLFRNFLHRICSWLDLFDPARTFSTRVPHLAVRNAGLLNAILALSSYHRSLDEGIPPNQRPDQNIALQYYYQTLHYVQKAMQYSTYQNSQELMATTLMVSTYEMLRGSRQDWQKHLQGVFRILRSRQIEVETSSLESTTWWAWLRQDIWVAFREKRRTYTSRAVWIMAQVINFCAVDSSIEMEGGMVGRISWAKALKNMLIEWQSHLTVEFSPLPTMGHYGTEIFKPHLIHPQCFGLAVQLHHCSRILIAAHEPQLDGIQGLLKLQKETQQSIDIVCGIGMTLNEDAPSMLSSQCLFIAGMFMQDPRQKEAVLEMLDSCQKRCGWPTPSLRSELEEIWNNPDALCDSQT